MHVYYIKSIISRLDQCMNFWLSPKFYFLLPFILTLTLNQYIQFQHKPINRPTYLSKLELSSLESPLSSQELLSPALTSPSSPILVSTQNTNTTIPLRSVDQTLFAINVSIGTPLQNFSVQFDTGSQLLWVPTTAVTKKGFNTNASSSYNNTGIPYAISYAGGGVDFGYFGYDWVVIPPLINVTQKILFVTSQNQQQFPFGSDVVGINGMSYQSNNFLDLAYKNKQINTSSFTLSLSNVGPSYFYYNYINESILNQTLFTNIFTNPSSVGAWSVQVIGVVVEDQDFTIYAQNVAVIDSGTTLFYLNPSLYNIIVSQYFPKCTANVNMSYLVCPPSQVSPPLKFLFPGVQIQIQNYTTCNSTQCQVYVNSLQDQSTIILLGDTLFYQYLITFNKQAASVGFNGQTQPIQVIGRYDWFLTAQYATMGVGFLLMLISIIFMGIFVAYSFKWQGSLQEASTMAPVDMITVSTSRKP